ncbi:uncharacterized protein PFL1_02222 [Pseudozyma flocculosa PF-1]|uniref:Uncharacterized protein n=1 Tax=Pseudozyma flocculosa TaxID=84751 RepID=A0A5C3FCU8_9BASI|nr:uncharacterized protein PFL1_02222 [Pseudozyma flocculosa PF-1]EPQ30105.1 hypothetical protein PFL1_02222 [Pseudozyma flocculosa PF-1]SPO41457.1 uncharacterized protein PSFLO_06939 [Pseudozyma flocculosa]
MSSQAPATATTVEEYTSAKSLVNLRKQLKYIVIGSVLTWYFQVPAHLTDALSLGIRTNWEARIAVIALSLLAATLLIFAHVILLPARGHAPDYLRWKEDVHLRSAIPALTLCIIAGFLSLLLTLSPLGAPAPPGSSLSTRLTQAATTAGSNLNSASRGVQQLASEAVKSLGLTSASNPSGSPKLLDSLFSRSPSSASSQSLLDTLHLDSLESLANRLGVSAGRADELSKAFAQLSSRAEDWAQGNVRAIGWTGALLASTGVYLLLFGGVGLLGFLAPDRAALAAGSKKKQF